MPWVLVAVAVMWVLALLFVTALCLSARRSDEEIDGSDDLGAQQPSSTTEPSAGVDDISVRRTARS